MTTFREELTKRLLATEATSVVVHYGINDTGAIMAEWFSPRDFAEFLATLDTTIEPGCPCNGDCDGSCQAAEDAVRD